MNTRNLRIVLIMVVVAMAFAAGAVAIPTTSGDDGWLSTFPPMGVGGRIGCGISWGGHVYVGGYFSTITDVAVDHVARLEMSGGTTQVVSDVAPLGAGLDDTVKDFCIHNGELIAAGYFDHSGTTVLNRVARWDGAEWQPFGNGLPGTWPQSAASFQGQLYVGDQRWNGSTWEVIFPANGRIYELIVHGDLLYVAGAFTEVDGTPYNYAFAWDGTQILDLDGGLPWPVRSGTDTDAGVVFCGNTDYTVGGALRWDGAEWIAEVSDQYIWELAWCDGQLFASASVYLGGGMFEAVLQVKNADTWHTISAFDSDFLFDHEGILLSGARPGSLDGKFAPGMVQYSNGAVRDVFLNNGGFESGFAALAPDGAGVIAVGDFKIAQGQVFDGAAQIVGSNWYPRGGVADLDTRFPGRFTDVAVAGTSVFGVYNWTDYDVDIHELVRSESTTYPWEWEIIDTGTWYYGLLQNVGSSVYSISRDGLKWVNPADGSLLVIDEFDLRGGIYGQCEYDGGFVISGSLSTMDDVPIGDVMHWAYGVWTDLGEPMPNLRVTAVAPMVGPQLAAASWVASSSNFVSIYDGSTWTQLPGEFSDMVTSLIFHRGRLFAGGKFSRIGSTWAPGIAVWSGLEWLPVGGGLRGGGVYDMASVGNLLYIVGNFELAGPHPSTGFAIWTGDPTALNGQTTPVTEETQLPSRLLDPAAPNPFNPRTQLSFTTSQAGHVMVEIYDVSGKRVRELVNETLEAGTHSRTWDGLDDGDRALPSGVYLARIFTGEGTDAVKMTLVR